MGIKKDGIWSTVKQSFITDAVFWENEVAANRFTAKALLLQAAVLVLAWILNVLGIFSINTAVMNRITLRGVLELVIPAVLFAVSAFCSAWFELGTYLPMYAAETKALYTRNIMTQYFGPKWLVFLLISIVCIEIARWGKRMVLEQASISKEHSRVETELDMARRIQERALPIVHFLPAQSRSAFDLAASMEPAIVVDEVYSNIVNYSGATQASVACTVDNGTVTLTFRDNGVPYDSTQADVPDITVSAEDRDIGGLGIFMTKKLTDPMKYSNDNGINCLTVRINY